MREREIGERVVVAIARKEYAGTIVGRYRLGYLVDIGEGGNENHVWKVKDEVYDDFSDGGKP